MAVQQFKGTYTVKLFYSDGAHEFRAMCRQLGITHEVSSPGQSQNNGIIERTNQEVEIGTAASLMQAGLPRPFWTFAAPCYCHLLNINPWQGTSKWLKAFGEDFPGKRLPFGCKVVYKPASTKTQDRGNWDPALAVGIFAGYRLRPGSHWSDEYLVWDVSDFEGYDLFDSSDALTAKTRNPHVTGRVFLYQDTLSFPSVPHTNEPWRTSKPPGR